MWDGFAPVDSSYSPPSYEGVPSVLTVHNAGPGAVSVELWDYAPSDPRSQGKYSGAVQLRAGDTRMVTVGMIVVRFLDNGNDTHAAVGWRFMGVV